MPEEVMNIYQRMHAVMADLKYIQKDEKKVANQYRAVTHDAVTAKVHGMLVQHRVFCEPTVLKREQEGNRTTVDMRLTFVNIDTPEEKISVDVFGYGHDNQDKGPGKAISYAVKYGYLKVFALETGDDPDNDQSKDYDFKGALEVAKKDHEATIKAVKLGIAENNYEMAAEAWWELTEAEQISLWVAQTKGGPFTTEERKIIKTSEFREAHFGTNEEVAA